MDKCGHQPYTLYLIPDTVDLAPYAINHQLSTIDYELSAISYVHPVKYFAEIKRSEFNRGAMSRHARAFSATRSSQCDYEIAIYKLYRVVNKKNAIHRVPIPEPASFWAFVRRKYRPFD